MQIWVRMRARVDHVKIFTACTSDILQNIIEVWKKSENKDKSERSYDRAFFPAGSSTVQEVGGHEQFQGNLWGNGEFWDLCGAVGVADFVGEVHTHFLQHMGPEKQQQKV